MRKNKKIFDYRLVFFTIIFLTVLIPVFSVIHEMGHAMVCYIEGNKFAWGVTPLGLGWLDCFGPLDDPTLLRLAGGLYAASVAAAVLVFVLPRFNRNTTSLAIPLSALAISQAVNALLEAFANDFYTNSTLSPGVSGIIIAVVVVLLVFKHSQKGVVKKNA